MTVNVYAIRDALTGYLTPTFERFDAAAIRNFEHAVLTPGTILDSHAGNFELCRIGEYDEQTGKLVPCDPVIVLSNGLSVQIAARQRGDRND